MKEETVYQMTKNIFENLGEIGAAHSAGARSSSKVRWRACPCRCTPAQRAIFKEKGLKVGS
jgi:TRAP-type uncharacterized transport system substrate-binding protein